MRRRGRPPHPDILTPREWEVLALLRRGLSNPQIAQQLGISLAGARYHVSEILGKLGLSSRQEAAAWQPERRPWWATAVAPLALLWRKTGAALPLTPSSAALALSGGLMVVTLGGLSLIGFLLLRGAAAAPDPSALASPSPTVATQTATPLPRNGRIAFVRGVHTDADDYFAIYVVEPDGTSLTRLTEDSTWTADLAWSPDGTQIAFNSKRDDNVDIYIMNPDGSGQTRLTDHPRYDGQPAWSPDGTKIAFFSQRGPDDSIRNDIYVMNADGSGRAELSRCDECEGPPAWSPDGTKIAFTKIVVGSDRTFESWSLEVYAMNADGSGQTRLSDHPARDRAPAWSPDGSQIAFYSDRAGNSDVYVMNADGSGQTRLTDDPGDDTAPVWSPDGTQIAFYSQRDPNDFTGNSDIYVVNADGTDEMRLTLAGYVTLPYTRLAWQPLIEGVEGGSGGGVRAPLVIGLAVAGGVALAAAGYGVLRLRRGQHAVRR